MIGYLPSDYIKISGLVNSVGHRDVGCGFFFNHESY